MNDAFLKEHYLTEEEVADILRLPSGVKTLRGRRARGTEHPPYVEIGHQRLYPKAMFLEWVSKRPVIWETKSAG